MYPLKIKEKYDPNNLPSLGHRFTVVYLGTYKNGDYTEGNGSHPGVDIIPVSKKQEVLSVLDGKVFKTGEDGAYGKFVFIEHQNAPHPEDLSRTTTLYSCYQHLSEIKVNIGDIVKEGDIIGNTGNTGNSFGEHLHFQIDKQEAPFHAYWPFTGAEVKAAGTSFTGGVNIGLGIDKAKLYTINPLVYLDKVEEYRKNSGFSTPKVEEVKEEKEIKLEIEKEEIPIIKEEVSEEIEVEKIQKIETITKPIETIKVEEVISKPIQEEKVKLATSNPAIISDSSIDFLSSLTGDEKKNFKDISKNDKYYDYINELAEKGFVVGYPDNTFRPNNFITRTEFLKLIFLVKGINLSNDNNNYFTDIKLAWQKKYINTAVNLRLVSTSNKKFNPNGNITRVEALKMAIVLFVGEISNTFSQKLNDVLGGEWFAKYVEYSIKNDLLPVVNNYFYPNKNITRYEVIGILKRLTGS